MSQENYTDSGMADRLRTVQRLHNIRTQKEFAGKIGIPEQTLSNYFNGTRKLSEEAIDGLRTRLGINLNWLFSGEGEVMTGGGTLPLPVVEARCESAPPRVVAEGGAAYKVADEPLLRRVDGQAIDPDTLDTLEMVLAAPRSAQAMIKAIARHATDVEKRLVELELKIEGKRK